MQCITIKEAAKRIGCISTAMLYRMAQQELIPVVRMGRRVLVDSNDIPGIIDSFKVQPKARA